MPPPPSTETKVFNSSVPNLFIFIVVAGAPALFCMAVAISSQTTREISIPFGWDRILSAFMGMIIFHAIFSLIGAWALSTFCPTTFSADGVATQSFTRGRRFVRWQDIIRARTLRLLNLQWLLVYPAGSKKALQLPLFQPRIIEFKQDIRRLAPPGNPILNYVQSPQQVDPTIYKFRETPRYIQATGVILAGLVAGIVFGLRGIRVVVVTFALALPFILALDALRHGLRRK
jgi:hypothetical protein